MKKKKSFQWYFTYGGIGALVGMTIGPIIKKGEFDLTNFLAGFTVFAVAFVIDLIRFLNKKNKTPDFDERTIDNVQKFYAYVSSSFIMVIFLLLIVLTSMGFETISLSYVWIIFIIYFVISGISALIVIKR